MKKLFLIVALVAGSISATLAQGQGGQQRTPEERVKMTIERMKTTVTGLTSDQEAKLTSLMLAQNKAQEAFSASVNARIAATLTDDAQKKAYAAYLAERGNRGFGGFGGPRGGGANGGTPPTPEERAKNSVERLKTAASLTLTADQEAKIAAIMVDQFKTQASMQTANSQQTLAVLTPEQQKAYTTMLEQRRQGGGGQRPAGQ